MRSCVEQKRRENHSQASEDRGGEGRLGEGDWDGRAGPEGDGLSVGVGGKAGKVELDPGVGVAGKTKDRNEGGSKLHGQESRHVGYHSGIEVAGAKEWSPEPRRRQCR